MEAYNRCVYGVKVEDFWILEKEGCDWISAHKLNGKANYVTETLHRNNTLYDGDGDGMSSFELEWFCTNRFFVMSKGGHAVSYDELNEFLNLWNKTCVPTDKFDKACENSAHIMLLRKCAFEAFGHRQSRLSLSLPGQQENVTKLAKLFDKMDIFPSDESVQREMAEGFFWNFVQRPTNVGSDRDAEKEKVPFTLAESALYDRLCKSAEDRADYDEFEVDVEGDDDDNISVVSSCVGSIGRGGDACVDDTNGPDDSEDWEMMGETERNETFDESLKKLGNVRKKRMSKHILKDMLGDDTALLVKDIKKNHDKALKKEKRKLDTVYIAVKHFENKMEKRRSMLKENIRKSVGKKYENKEYSWKSDYDDMMKEIRAKK